MRAPGGRRVGSGEESVAVERAFREERAGILATLIRHVGDFQLAEDAVQDAFAAAVATWPRDGFPQTRARGSRRLRDGERSTGCAGRVRSPTAPTRLAELARLDSQETSVGDARRASSPMTGCG